MRIDFLHPSQSGGRLIKFKNLNLHATLYHAVNVGERHFRQTFCPTSRSRERPWIVVVGTSVEFFEVKISSF